MAKIVSVFSITCTCLLLLATVVQPKLGGGRQLHSDKSFPTWVMGADHKLLQSSTVAADIVVAIDGSENYKTISEAVAASVKVRNGTKRFVIHVKASVYSENAEITKSTKNLMFIGDGNDSTIVTGSKNVHDGSSTFNSLTFVFSITFTCLLLLAMVVQPKSGGGWQLLFDKLFPTWVMGADHKLLQSSAVVGDIVVAKDGSGNYKTISEAVAVSVKLRNGTKRFVIHVKASVYSENVEITKSMKNLMFIGDGNDSTIVTGSKNVHDGSSNFNSSAFATVVQPKSGGCRQLLSDKSFPTWVMGADHKLLQSSTVAADVVVAKDGSGNYKIISEAVAASVKLRNGTKRFVIHVKASVYTENVEITKSMKNLMFIGEGKDSTIVTGNKNVHDGSSTFNSLTFGISSHGFIARNMTFQNTEGSQKGQASSTVATDIVVAIDGLGNYKTISEAVAASVELRNGTKRFVIRVKASVYSENVEISKSMKNLMFIGDGNDSTIVTVEKDGSGNYKTISEAVAASIKLRNGIKRFVIHVKASVYSENV
ncbi:hypothetical protein MRB53_029982 [Persea americana]|uniref:Uncharacterized protein n=1 Tax=Persea americana TaxID=3435 RepID=A0ACC2KK97_PERAE|nr:hypothetical protein MRB53_029982 [Persea americana]